MISSTLLAQPALADPCLSSETLALIEKKLGQVGALAFVAGTGLNLCSNESSEFQQSLQRISELSASAESYPELISCPSSAGVSTQSEDLNLAPNEAGYSTGPTKTCSCSQYKVALREAQAALRKLAE